MAEAHPGYTVGNDTRLRLLLGIFEATAIRRPPTHRELQNRTGISNGSITHHLPLLAKELLIEFDTGARNARITPAGLAKLAQAGLIEPIASEPVYALTAKGLRLLEIAPPIEDEPRSC